MSKAQNQKANPSEKAARVFNSASAAYPNFNEQGIFNAGMTKSEFALIEFVAAHLQAHGKYPDKNQLMALGELSIQVFDRLVPALAVGQINPTLAHDLMDGAEFPTEEIPE